MSTTQSCWDLVQCTHQGCIYVAAAEDNPTHCIFHGETTFTSDVTSDWILSKRKHMYRLIPGGHMSIYRGELLNEFVGVVVSINGESTLVTDRHSIEIQLPKSHWFYVDEVFNVVHGNFNRHKTQKVKYVDTPSVVACRICGYTDARLDKHLRQQHHMTVQDYRKLFYHAPIICDKMIERYIAYKNGENDDSE